MAGLILFLLFFFFVCTLVLLFRRSSPNSGSRKGKIRIPIEDILRQPVDICYDNKDVPSPSFSGTMLKVVSRLQHSVFGKYFVYPLIKTKNRLDVLSGEYIPEMPTFSPAHIPYPSRPTNHDDNSMIIQSIVENYIPDELSHKRNCIDFHNAYKSGYCDPLSVTQSILQAISQSNSTSPPLRAIVQFESKDILRMAKMSSKRYKNGKPLSYLDGVPVSIKGCYEVSSYECFAGASFKPTATKSVGVKESLQVSRLKEAGAIVIGIANLQDFCAGITGSNPNGSYKTPRNPYNTDHYCGGSSSGSASSVAAGLCVISLGSDAGGSIRIPAAHCGVVGLKPTFGLLDTTGLTPFTHTVGVVGPLAASVLDIAIVMDILCPDVKRLDLSYFCNDTLDDMKIGIYWEYFEHADKEIVVACKHAVETMVTLGAECIDIKIPELEEAKAAHFLTTTSEFGLSLAPDIDSKFHLLSGETLGIIGSGYTVSAIEYINAQKQRTRSIRALEMLFDEVDVIVTPTSGCLAPVIPPAAETTGILSTEIMAGSTRFSFLGNLTGIPGIAVPVGMSSTGLPISLQIMGPWFEEGRLIHIARVLEKKVIGEIKKPPVYYDTLI